MTKRYPHLLAGLALAVLSAVLILILSAPADAAPRKPNVFLIFVDDMGYGDPGVYGGGLVPTPHIDRIGREGVRFTDGYVTAAVCGPSRVGLLTGAYQNRFGVYWNPEAPRAEYPPAQKLLPQALKPAGYVTGIIGKWNLKGDPKAHFDEAYHIMCWEGDYWPQGDGRYIGVDDPKKVDSGKIGGIWGPRKPGERYLTDVLTEDACGFIERHQDRLFFLYLAYNAVHTPLHAKRAFADKVAHLKSEPERLYGAMVLSLDEGVGKVLDALDAHGLAENTLVAFVSDNGPAIGTPHIKGYKEEWPDKLLGTAGPLREYKAKYYEGGIRVPFMLRWPGGLKAGTVETRPVSTLDLYPTFCALAGANSPAGATLDGVNLLPYLAGDETGAPHDIMFWSMGPRGAVREGEWKLVVVDKKAELFNLDQDLGETTDLSEKYSAKKQALLGAYREWLESMPPAVETAKKTRR